MKKVYVVLCAGVALLATSAANAATIEVTPGNPTPNLTNVFFVAETPTTEFVGNVGSQDGTQQVTFTTNVDVTVANGFAQFNPVGDTPIGTVTLTSDTTFTQLVFSAQLVQEDDITVTAFLNGVEIDSQTLIDVSNGNQNQSFLVTIIGGVADSLIITSEAGLLSLRQFELSGGTTPAEIPLPPALVLFGSALLGMGLLARRRKQALVQV